MFSDNIIERTQATSELLTLDWFNGYFLMVAILMIICWRLKEWL